MISRFKLLLEQLRLSPAEFADRIGVQRSSVSHVLSGRNKPSIDFLEKILRVFPETDSTWLITGRISSNKVEKPGEVDAVNENILSGNTHLIPIDNEKKQAPADEEPVDHIIVVYKNNTFRFLNPSEK